MKNKKLIMESGGVKQIKRRYTYYKKMKLSETWRIRVNPCQAKRVTFQKLHGHFKIDWRHVRGEKCIK